MRQIKRATILVCVWAAAAFAQVTIPAPLETGPTASGISPPTLTGASNCSKNDWRVALRGGEPGDFYEINESVGNPVAYVDPVAQVPVAPNADGVTIVDISISANFPDLSARIITAGGLYSGFSVPLPRRNPSSLQQPEIPFVPLWECGRATLVSGHQPGDRIELLSSLYGTRSSHDAFGTLDYVPAGGPGPFKAGEIVTTQYATCEGQPSPVSQPAIVAVFPSSPLQPPALRSESLSVGVSRFVVEGLEHGATLFMSLERAGSGISWQEFCAGPECTAYLPPTLGTLEEGDLIKARQEMCPGTRSTAVGEEVKQCGDVAPAEINPAPKRGDMFVHLARFPLGARVRVYATPNVDPTTGLTLIGYAHDVNPVPLARPIKEEDLWVVVAIDTPGCNAQAAQAFFVGQ